MELQSAQTAIGKTAIGKNAITKTGISTDAMVVGLRTQEDSQKLTLHGLVVVVEQSLLAVGACGLLHHLM